jgi:hypothetical protein
VRRRFLAKLALLSMKLFVLFKVGWKVLTKPAVGTAGIARTECEQLTFKPPAFD